MRYRILGISLCLWLVLAVSVPVYADESVYIRANQMGYLPDDPKSALVLSNAELTGFELVDAATGDSVFDAGSVADRGAYGDFAHLYELTFSDYQTPGQYQLKVGAELSHPFIIGDEAYAGLMELTLQFFRVQRSGDTDPLMHQPSHLKDGIASGGPNDGAVVDATGGWYDAGDYIKFSINESYAANLMLIAFNRKPEVFADTDSNGVPDVLDEARIGLDWLLKMWDSEQQVLYYQVGDGTDHDIGWRMPEDDDTQFPPRKVYASEAGKGVNVAGSAAAALAQAAVLWNNPDAAYYDAALAAQYLQTAESLYAFGQANPQLQNDADEFYTQETWKDKMALAAVELYRATQKPDYLAAAKDYASDSSSSDILSWPNVHVLADYELARVDPSYLPTAQEHLESLLESFAAESEKHPFRAAVNEFYWGSIEGMAGQAATALLYQDLTGDTRYYESVVAQRNFIFGVNPWGVSFVNGTGTVYPHHPHHQIADLTGEELRGFWDEGPVTRSTFEGEGIELGRADEYAAFQTDEAVYHDITEDYVTNEPTITMNSVGLIFAVWFVPTVNP